MRTLILDTSAEKGLIALAEGTKIVFERPLQSSRELFAQLPALKDIDAVAVTVGPGSYTGIRVGLAAAKGIAFGLGVPLIPLCSLDGFVSPLDEEFFSVIDARMGGAYIKRQRRQGNEIFALSEPEKVPIEQVPADLPLYGPSLQRFPCGNECWPCAQALALAAGKKTPQPELVPLYL